MSSTNPLLAPMKSDERREVGGVQVDSLNPGTSE